MPKKVLTHFKKNDPLLYEAIIAFDKPFRDEPEKKADLFASLCRTIAGQQLSGSAADSIWNRFRTLFPKNKPTARRILNLSKDELRAVGFSYAKIRALYDLSEKVSTRTLSLGALRTANESHIGEQLQKIIGVGPWTTEMFLMFALGREDVFSTGDLGLKKGIAKIYSLKTLPTPEEMEDLSQKWRPYRTYAACAIWTILDNR